VPEYVEPARLDTAPPAPAASLDRAAIAAMIEHKVNEALGTMQERLLSALRVVAEEVAAGHQDTADDVSDAVRSLRIELSELTAALAELRTAFASERERNRVSDLPALSSPRRGLN
jgi:hypothetical protein